MLRVTVDFHHATTGKKTTPLVLEIANDGSGDRVLGNYDVEAHGSAKAVKKRRVRIQNYQRSLGIPSLVALALSAITTGHDFVDVAGELERHRRDRDARETQTGA